MLFNSFHFIVFFPIVAAIYFGMPHRFRWMLLLVASYYFYMCWRPEYIILIVLSTFVDFWVARKIEDAPHPGHKKILLLISLFVNFGLLFTFKYFNFVTTSLNDVFSAIHAPMSIPALDVLLPVGISFYTFQVLGYLIDVYRGTVEAEKNLLDYALFVTFFPQLLSGPIGRADSLLPQLAAPHRSATTTSPPACG